jgi:hypothetical protein
MLTAFVTVFSIPPAADACAPTFQRLSARFRNVVLFETSASGVNECGNLVGCRGLHSIGLESTYPILTPRVSPMAALEDLEDLPYPKVLASPPIHHNHTNHDMNFVFAFFGQL